MAAGAGSEGLVTGFKSYPSFYFQRSGVFRSGHVSAGRSCLITDRISATHRPVVRNDAMSPPTGTPRQADQGNTSHGSAAAGVPSGRRARLWRRRLLLLMVFPGPTDPLMTRGSGFASALSAGLAHRGTSKTVQFIPGPWRESTFPIGISCHVQSDSPDLFNRTASKKKLQNHQHPIRVYDHLP